MKNRLQQFLEVEQLSPARLAEIMNIQRSGLSHILSGRNKPGFDFIHKLLLKFPTLSADWLITGKGKMYKDQNREISQVEANDQTNDEMSLFSHEEPVTASYDNPKPSENFINQPISEDGRRKKILKRILLVFNDNTFEDITPGKVG